MAAEIIFDDVSHGGGGNFAEPIRDQYNDRAPRFPRKSTQYVDDLGRDFSRMNIKGEKKEKDRRKSITVMRRRSTGEEKKMAKNYELYRFEKKALDWTIADKVRTYVPPEELAKKASKAKGKVTEQLQSMNYRRRAHITRLLEEKNYGGRGAEWYLACIEAPKTRDGKVPVMDVIIAQSAKFGTFGSPNEKRMSFLGEKSDLRDSNSPKGKDKGKDKYKDEGLGYEDNFGDQELFNSHGRPLEHDGRPFDGERGNRRLHPLPDPIAGPIPGLQSPGGWSPPQQFHPQGNHDVVEILGDDHDGHGGHGNVLDLDNILDDGHGGHHGGQQGFDRPHLDDFGAPKRRKSGKKGSHSRPRQDRLYNEEPKRRYKYDNSSEGTAGDEVSVFFDEDDKSSYTSFGADAEFVRRGSLSRPNSKGRHEPFYREHRRRGTYAGTRRNSRYGEDMLLIEPAGAPRRPTLHHRSRTLPQIGYDRDQEYDAPLSPRDHRNYSPLRRAPPEVFYPGELMRQRDYEKDREAEHYMRGHDLRLREEEVRRQERELDERDFRRHGGGKPFYRDHRDRDYRI